MCFGSSEETQNRQKICPTSRRWPGDAVLLEFICSSVLVDVETAVSKLSYRWDHNPVHHA